MNRTRSSSLGFIAAIVILAACAATVQPAVAKGHASHSFKAPKAPKAETTKAPDAKVEKHLNPKG